VIGGEAMERAVRQPDDARLVLERLVAALREGIDKGPRSPFPRRRPVLVATASGLAFVSPLWSASAASASRCATNS
jgi:hypothetical protein